MAEYFEGKDYEEYFALLQSRLSSDPKTEKATENPPSAPVRRTKGGRRGARYFVFALMALTVLAGVANIGALNQPAKATENTTSEIKYDAAGIAEEQEIFLPKITGDTLTLGEETDAEHVIIIESETGRVVAQKNPRTRAYPASTTKIMTLLVAAELISDMDDKFIMTREITDSMYIAKATVAGFVPGEAVCMRDLLYGTILPSGGDAALGLANKLCGSEEGFVILMNRKAKALGLADTHFAGVTGLHDKDNYTTAWDMAVILKAAMENDVCREILSTYQHTTLASPEHPEGILLSSTLFSYMYGTEPETAVILGGKTGYTDQSGYCIASFGQNNETKNEYIVVTLKSSARRPAFFGQIELYSKYVK